MCVCVAVCVLPCVCVCVFLFYAVGERAEARKPEPGTDYRAGRAKLPGYITRGFSLAAVRTGRALRVCVCVCVSYLTSGVMCSAEGRHATEPGTDYKTGRAELPTPILPYNSPDRRMTLPTDARTRMACPAVSFGPVRAREKGKRSW